jgi:hypothetical protein
MARYRPALALLGALSISSAQAAFDGNDVYQWCRTNRSMTLAYSAGIIDQNARVTTIADSLLKKPNDCRGGLQK